MRQQRIPPPPKGESEAVILFAVGGFNFAIAASAVGEIRSMEGLQRFEAGAGFPHLGQVEYTLERNGTIHFVVNAGRHFHLPPSASSRVMILRLNSTALLVDSTDRMTEISVLHALPQAFTGAERQWYRGLVMINDRVIPVVNQTAFLSTGNIFELKAAVRQTRGVAVV